jgi:hypothetical protein
MWLGSLAGPVASILHDGKFKNCAVSLCCGFANCKMPSFYCNLHGHISASSGILPLGMRHSSARRAHDRQS